MYSGVNVENAIAERTRNVQAWGVLSKWQASFKRPINFSDLAAQWAPGSRGYAKMMETIGERFGEFCSQPDPRPQLVQEARGNRMKPEAKPVEVPSQRQSGSDLARRAVDQGTDQRSALGGQELATTSSSMPLKLLNSAAPEPDAAPQAASLQPIATLSPGAASPADPLAKVKDAPIKDTAKAKATQASATAPPKAPNSQPSFQMASAAGAAKPLVQAPPAASQKCRVWTASYGGQKALIIRSLVDKIVNYTVLDVNEGAEKREADAFISAYAKEGVIAGEFGSQAQALDKAFELCPEG
jgi:hypothetical protein